VRLNLQDSITLYLPANDDRANLERPSNEDIRGRGLRNLSKGAWHQT
jgi:hypothetical protein